MLLGESWALDEPWTPLHHDLSDPLPDTLVTRAGLTIEVVRPDRADAWMEVHWSAFKGTPFGDAERRDVVDWWSTMMEGPFAQRGRSLAALDSSGRAVAIAGVWSAGRGRLGLVEPMGVHRDHRGKGYGAAICEAAATALRQMGSSTAIVCAETSNTGPLATYAAAGFTARPPYRTYSGSLEFAQRPQVRNGSNRSAAISCLHPPSRTRSGAPHARGHCKKMGRAGSGGN